MLKMSTSDHHTILEVVFKVLSKIIKNSCSYNRFSVFYIIRKNLFKIFLLGHFVRQESVLTTMAT